MIREEIMKLLSDSDVNSAYRIESVGTEFPAYVVRMLNKFGVAVFYSGDPVSEEFANAELYNGTLIIDNVPHSCLFLTSSIEETRNEFAVFCEDFVDPGNDGEKRKTLVDSPIDWWKGWKFLIGNAIMEKRPYSVLGELLMYEYLIKQGRKVEWGGPKATSHDLVCKDEEYEVKSTTNRYGAVIHVAGQFQMQQQKRLYLYFCRFEANANGISINDVVERLISRAGESAEELNGKLARIGYGVGSSARNEKYQIHEVLEYKVDDEFPKIIPESFVGGKVPKGINHLEYDVDLSLLDGAAIEII